MTDEVDPLMDAMQPPGPHPMGDRATRQPTALQLRASDHAVLSRRDLVDPGVTRM
jgi:hypothetical protein